MEHDTEPFIISVGGFKWDEIGQITGYKPITTFWQDFSIADMFGEKAIEDTYNRAFNEWKDNVKFMTELALVLSWKLWDWAEKNEKMGGLYEELWQKQDRWCVENLKGEDLKYFLSTTG